MKSVTILLLTAGLVSAVVVPVQLAEREALQSAPGVDIPECKNEVEKRAIKFAHLVARVEAAPATAPRLPAENQTAPAEGQPKPVESQPGNERGEPVESAPPAPAPPAESQIAPVEGQQKPAESQPANERGKPAESAPSAPAPTQEQNQGNKDQNQNENQNGNQNQNQNGNKDNNRNGNNNNNNNNNDINQIIQNGVQNGTVLQGIFTPAITGIINNMGLGQNVNVQAIQGLNFPNQIVVLNQLQQLQTLMQFNIVQRQQVVTFVGQGISNNGVKIALLKRDVDDLSTAKAVAAWDT